MGFEIISEYSLWFILLCLAGGFGYAFILYRKDKKLEEVNIWIQRLLFSCRSIVVSFLFFFLLSPLIKTITRQVEKPVVIVAQDNSESIISNKDSSYYKGAYKEQLNNFIETLKDKYEVKTFSFGDNVKEGIAYEYNEKQTSFSSLLKEIDIRYSNRNLGAVILASDGIYNRGSSPVNEMTKLKVPVYTIALGDTSIKKDIVLNKVSHNRLAYLRNNFFIEVVVSAKQLQGKSTVLDVVKDGNKLFTQKIDVTDNSFNVTIPVKLEAKQVGIQRYRISFSTVEGEFSLLNNSQDIFIDVLDAREKILILAAAPHPDIAAVKSAIETNRNYEVESFIANEFDKPLKQYNLVILDKLPDASDPIKKIITEIKQNNIPVLIIAGDKSELQTGLTISGSLNKSNEAEAYMVDNFPLFTMSDELKQYVKNFPAVECPFGNYAVNNSANVLLYQKIGMVQTQNPLLLFNVDGENKTGIIAGEGIWRWKLRDFADHGNHNLFDELIGKTIQYLSVKMDKSFFRVTGKNNFYENEPIEFEAEVYNDSYELINDPEVIITITNTDNKKFPFTFSKTVNAYRVSIGMLPVGQYKYEAITKTKDKLLTQKGEFSVSPLVIEKINTIADHQLLYNIAQKSGGEMVYPDNIKKLEELLAAREDVKPVSYSQKKLTDLINFKGLLFLLLTLLSLEWFLRKRSGAY